MLAAVNADVNALNPATAPLHPISAIDRVFDCDDYAAIKRDRLESAGVPPGMMHLRTVTTWQGQRHMVLEVGGYILDSLRDRIAPRSEAERYYTDWH